MRESVPWPFKSRLEERTRPFCCCNGKTKAAGCLGGKQGGGKMTAVQRNQIKSDNKWSAEEACGQRAEVRRLLTTTITLPASVGFICSICRFPILVCITLSHFFLILFHHLRHFSGSHSPYMSFLHSFIYFSLHFLFFSPLFDFFFGGTIGPSLCLSLFNCPTLNLWLCSITFLSRNNTTFWEKHFLAFFQILKKEKMDTSHVWTLNTKLQPGDS